MSDGVILGIDYGTRRMGVAASDPLGIVATPRAVVQVRSDGGAREAVARFVEETGACRIVVGLPLNMDGTSSEMTTRVRAFAEALRGELAVPVVMWDERLSSAQAERAMVDADVSRARRREVTDKIAAQIMLQSYLDSTALPVDPGDADGEWA
jgi:putative Holliday junction resolvase